ncbi:hypothetical protein HOC01_04645 [archaeon]|nr:hypothetical protein [archaeon]MBT6698255.1 hypothetical protein [archaeon]
MEDIGKYLVAVVGIVALVGLVLMVTAGDSVGLDLEISTTGEAFASGTSFEERRQARDELKMVEAYEEFSQLADNYFETYGVDDANGNPQNGVLTKSGPASGLPGQDTMNAIANWYMRTEGKDYFDDDESPAETPAETQADGGDSGDGVSDESGPDGDLSGGEEEEEE